MNKHRQKLEALLRTPEGCDGGNIRGRHWLFGIEYGGEATQNWFENCKVEEKHGERKPEEVRDFVKRWPFNRNITKLEAVIHGWRCEEYQEFAVAAEIFTATSDFYKGNLGALAFVRDSEETFAEFSRLTGIASKAELQELEISIRAKMFQGWKETYKPDVILCFGIGNADRFRRAFGSADSNAGSWERLDRNWFFHEPPPIGQKTHLFILPHATGLGGWGLTSHKKNEAFGKMIRERLQVAGVVLKEYPGN